jgi:hypothetical protein
MLNWLSSEESVRFGQETARFVMQELASSNDRRDAKFARHAEKVLQQVDRRLAAFKSRERLNVYKRAKLANAFLWGLKEGGCAEAYANELTEWLTLRL